jgi:hypothetical protein
MGRHHDRFPKTDGRAYVVGATMQHLGEVLYRKLFRPGLFWIIKDEETGLWRTYRWWTDEHRKKERRPSPALIPARYIKSQSYRLKKDLVPKTVKLHNGWEISFFTGEGIPAQGFDIDVALCDEEVQSRDWINELFRGLIDREGTFIWSCAPQNSTETLLGLWEKKGLEEFADLDVSGYRIPVTENPHIKPKEIERRRQQLTPEEIAVFIDGYFATSSFLMFPEFSQGTHCINQSDLPGGQIPPEWTRYVAVDPGIGRLGVLFAAVPPPSHPWHDRVILYDEIYAPRATAYDFGQLMAHKSEGCAYEKFIIDMNRGSATESSGYTIAHQYETALAAYGVRSFATGSGFEPGFDDVVAGCSLIKTALRMRYDGRGSQIRIVRDKCPNLISEMTRLRRNRVKTQGGAWVYEDKPAPRQDSHLVDCLRYTLGTELPWVQPVAPKPAENWAVTYMKWKQQRAGSQRQPVTLGPATAGNRG